MLVNLLIALLPSRLKIFVLRSRGATVGQGCYIGFSIIDAKEIEIGDCVMIASFNLVHRLDTFVCKSGSRIGMGNWITGALQGSFFLGRNSSIERFHFFDAPASIFIDENALIAGRGSHFFTHGISSTNLSVKQPISIGAWTYVGTSSRFAPGSGTGEGTFVGMGSVVTKRFTETYVLIAGAPAVIKKQLSLNDTYFARPYLPHDHQPAEYNGTNGTLSDGSGKIGAKR